MTKDLAAFRREILDALQVARRRWPEAKLYLLYAPCFDDPFRLTDESTTSKRTTALIPFAKGAGYEKQHYPRVIEFDCRKVAPYLLETDPALDDPLFEASITAAHQSLTATTQEPDGEEGTGSCLGGWVVSPDSADTIARRLYNGSQRTDRADGRRYWLRWFDPRMMALLWPQLTTPERTALLGEQLSWIALDAAKHLVEFSSLVPRDDASPAPGSPSLPVTQPQWVAAHHVGLVNHLVEVWRVQHDGALPNDATHIVHREIVRAESVGLTGRDLQAFVLAAAGLCAGFEQDPRLQAAVRHAMQEPGTLSERIRDLPSEFWERYARPASSIS